MAVPETVATKSTSFKGAVPESGIACKSTARVGWFETLAEAEEHIENNRGDLAETFPDLPPGKTNEEYKSGPSCDYAVVEEVGPGLYRASDVISWWRFVPEPSGTSKGQRYECPPEYKNVVAFGMG